MPKKKKFELSKKSKGLSFETEIKKRPWEFHPTSLGPTSRCHCSELRKLFNTSKLNRTGLSDGKPLLYQKFEEEFFKTVISKNLPLTDQFSKTFQIQCKFPLSVLARSLLASFTNKYIYYAIDDILYMSDLSSIERKYLLDIFYSSMLSLHNDFSINFFDIWIDSIYLNTDLIENRFLKDQKNSSSQISTTTITLKLHYFTRIPVKSPESIW